MSQNFITESELDKRLELYEKLGTAEKEIGNAEERIKKYLREYVDQSQIEIKKLIEEKNELLLNKIQANLKNQLDLVTQSIQKIAIETTEAVIEKAKREIELQINTDIKNKTDELRVSNNLSQKAFEANLEKLVSVKLNEFELDFQKRKNTFEEEWIEKSKIESRNAINSLKKEISEQTENQINETLKKVLNLIDELKSDLTLEMSKKLVDKNAIEQKIKEIEFELTNKTLEIIDFNINQARFQMEQSARAEVQEGIKQVASQIIAGLS
jgi:hypothetical protein